jgi:signal peptidase I
MEPAIPAGDAVVVDTNMSLDSIKRGTMIVFKHPQYFPCSGASGGGASTEDLVKRVIGLPREMIVSHGNTIFINGKPLSEPGWFRTGEPQVGAMPITKTTIPPGDYFVMGDNRTDSCDSRSFGVIPASSIVGNVIEIISPDGSTTSVP